MKKGMKDTIERKKPSINEVNFYNSIPMFSFIELNINEICNRVCPFCPRVDPEIYPNQNIHMSVDLAEKIDYTISIISKCFRNCKYKRNRRAFTYKKHTRDY